MLTNRAPSVLRHLLQSEASGGLVLMGAAALALVAANSPLSEHYFAILQSYIGPLSIGHWINDALMAIFFLLVGLEIKREMLDGQLSSWRRQICPGVAALGGMIVPAIIYVTFNWNHEIDTPRLGDTDGDRHRVCLGGALPARLAYSHVPQSLPYCACNHR